MNIASCILLFGALLPDSVQLETVYVQSYFVRQPLLRSTASAAVIGPAVIAAGQGTTLVHTMNTVPGLRMEERSPGSYRLSIRGSLLRSPFGVRNVKVYMDEIPLTDAGGNTYFNLLDPGAISAAEVLKGPDGSLFGANSGGVVRLQPFDGAGLDPDRRALNGGLQVQGGSYGLLHQQLGLGFGAGSPADSGTAAPYWASIHQSYQRSDGYREHTALDKRYLQTYQRWDYRPGRSNQIRLLALYGDLDYQTPGGLNAGQYAADRRAARPATPVTPGAVEQQAGIRNRTLIAGLVHEWKPLPDLRHVAAVFGSHTDFTNPFITNYEERDERNLGLRSYLSYVTAGLAPELELQVQAGLEWQHGGYLIENYDNLGGKRGPAQAIDHLRTRTGTAFVRLGLDYRRRWMVEASLSRNTYSNQFGERSPTGASPQQDAGPLAVPVSQYRLPAAWMPRVAFSYRITPGIAWRAVVSKGFSPPTVAEIRPSDQLINIGLKAETGWNYETGLRLQSGGGRFSMDLTAFVYRMENALVRATSQSGAEFFRNAGGTRQAGLEWSGNVWLIRSRPGSTQSGIRRGSPDPSGPGPALAWSGSWAWSHFRFVDFRTGNGDFSGNALTGVPVHTFVQGLHVYFPSHMQIHLHHQYTSSLPLDDANTVYAGYYHLLHVKLDRTILLSRIKPLTESTGQVSRQTRNPLHIRFFAGGDNLLNQQYSLGHDINAFGGRYFNAAPIRNFYGGVSLIF